MAYLERQQFRFRDTTTEANVPNNDIAKLMYYLNCVCYCIDYNDNDIRRFTNYSNWRSLSDEEDKMVYYLALTLHPNLFIDKVFFHNVALSGNMQGRFYEIGQISHQMVVVPSLVIAGRTCEVHKILAFKEIWLTENYIDPIKRLQRRFRSGSSRSCVIS